MVSLPLGRGEDQVIVVIGGGVAGAATSIHLARAGAAVALLEREPGPAHKVCGEFISIEAQEMLGELGVDLADAVPLQRLRLRTGRQAAESVLPFRAVGLSRRALDQRLLDRAAAVGASVRRGIAVRALAPGAVILRDGGEIRARSIVLATGKHDLRDLARPHGSMLSLKMHFDGAVRSLAGTVELRLFDGGYAGLQPVEDGRVNLCLAVERDRFPGWPVLIERLAIDPALRPCWVRPLAVAAIPYGYLHRGVGRVYRVGDQFAVIPSFAGDGIAIALHSAGRIAAAILAGQDAGAAHARLAAELAPQLRRAGLIARLFTRPRIAVAAARLAPALVRHAAQATRLAAWV
jgi:flavin-dependent dehydrogenase